MTTATQNIDKAFLQGKSFECLTQWNGGKYPVTCTAASGNIARISDNVFRFTQHNFLPTSLDGKTPADDILNGHFTFYVNAKTFEYLAYKSSDYANFTSVTPMEFNGFYTSETLPELSRKRIESVIAHKLLGAYFHDHNAVNQNGANLIDPQTPEPAGNGFNEGIMRHSGFKQSLICDNRGYIWCDYKPETLCEADLLALKTLDNWTPPELQEFPEDLLKSLRSKLTGKKGVARQVDFEFAGLSLRMVHYVDPIYGNSSILGTTDNVKLSQLSTKHSLTKFIRLIPEILRNYSSASLK